MQCTSIIKPPTPPMPAAGVKVSCLETWPVSLHHGQFIYMFKCVLSHAPNASHMWVFWAGARNERRHRTMSLSERRGRHVTHSSLSCPLHPHHFSGGSKNPLIFSICPPSTPKIKNQRIDDETRRPDRQLASGGPTHPSRARLGRAPLIFDREALRASARPLQSTYLHFIVHSYNPQCSDCSPLHHPKIRHHPRAGLQLIPPARSHH